MIRAFFGLELNPFNLDNCALLPHQQEIYDILKVHSQQGGLCLILGDPGTGKSLIKEYFKQKADKRTVVIHVSRTLHTYQNTIKILCHAFNVEFQDSDFKCELRLTQEAYRLNQQGKFVITIIDDAHLMDFNTLRKLRLLFEDFPKNHNLILIGQPYLLQKINLIVNEDIKSRVTYSVCIPKLNPDDMRDFILGQLDSVGLGHNTFSDDSLALIARSSEGIIRKTKDLALSCLIETVRERKKQVDLNNVNRILIQPHWRVKRDLD